MSTDNKRTFIKGISVQGLITVIMGVLELIVFAVMSRLLTKTEFGYYAIILGVITITTSITESGFGAAIIQKKDATKSFINTAFSLSWIMGLTGMLIMLVLAPFIARTIADDTITFPLRIMSINIFFACAASVGKSMLIRDLHFKTFGIYEVVAYFLSSAIGILLAVLGLGLYSIVSISVCNYLLLNIFLYTRSVKLPCFSIAFKEVKEIFSFGGWLTLGVVVNNITQQLDKLLLPKWLSVETLGAYNRPAGFINTVTGKINGIFDTVLFPMLSSIQTDGKRVSSVLLQAVSILNSFSGILFCIFFFNANLIVSIFFGKEWISLVTVFQIISIYVLFNIDNRLVDCFFRSLGLVELAFYLRLFSAILTFFFIFLGCKQGLYGVALALVLANILTATIKMIVLIKKTSTSLREIIASFLKAMKAALPLVAEGVLFLMLFKQPTILEQLLFAAIMGISFLVEFFVFPHFIGEDYYNAVYSIVKPTIEKIVRKKS